MAETSPRRISPLVAFVIGVVVALLLAFAWMGWTRTQGAAHDLDIAVPRGPDLPIPKLPDAPRIPDAPVPSPR
jgi:hypothetical protein